jgi:hypothetical protein
MSIPIIKLEDKELAKTVGIFIVFLRYVPNNFTYHMSIPVIKVDDKLLAKTSKRTPYWRGPDPEGPKELCLDLIFIYYFRNFGEEATIYTGDMKREDSILLEWLLDQKDPSN